MESEWRITGVEVDPEPRLIERIWARDPAVWGPGEDDPRDRLGWLDLPDRMAAEVARLESFAAEGPGISTVALLGMGGSSLAPEVFARTLGPVPGRPPLEVGDSTHPAEVIDLTGRLDLERTSWIVSSKSGTTIETMSLYRHFRALRDKGDAFIAITDPGTPLETLGGEEDFGEVFLNPPDIGGRFSALSLFGLVPAALIGADLDRLLTGAAAAKSATGPDAAPGTNSALVIGTAIAELARQGRNKLTWVVSEAIESFGDWVEQLIAESTGKNGTGICPIVGEPLAPPEAYGDDRVFVHLSLAGDTAHDDFVSALRSEGHPVVSVELLDVSALGAEMFRWEVATAVAGAVLGINAFDQPDVEAAKRGARDALQSVDEKEWPNESPEELLEGTGPGDLVALLAFAPRTPTTESALARARTKLVTTRGVATSAGFGPRYLHSTGQLHKGGPKGVRALVILDEPAEDVPIPGRDYGFAALVTAQALGDATALEKAGRRVACTRWATFEAWTND